MKANTFENDVKSFVSFALAMEPSVKLPVRSSPRYEHDENDDSVEFRFSDTKKLSEHEFSTIESLVEKYGKLEEFIPSGSSLDTLQVFDARPTVTFEPGKNYQLVQVNAGQLEIAKDVARHASAIHQQYTAGRHDLASGEFDKLQRLLKERREEFLGDFQSLPEIEDAFGTHGVGPQQPTLGWILPVFIWIEIWVG